jgi:amino acid transporter
MAPRGQSLMWLRIRTALFGSPLTTEKVEHSRVGVLGGIPIFGSDIISSQGYAPDEILMVLLLAGAVGYSYLMKVSLVIIILLASIFMVYRKAISKYPQGAGSYVISKNNLGEMFALIAGSSLTIEYVLTVAVSVSSAIENLTGIFPILATHKILACWIIILFLTWINLRGLKESAKLFALPVYLYIASLALLVFTGISEIFLYGVDPTIVSQNMQKTAEGSISVMTWFIFARAFAGGTTALTGFEAVASGVSAFKIPNQKRATQTLFILALIVGAGLAGITFLAGSYHIVPSSGNTALNQLGLIVFGKTIFYYVLMGCAASILIIASNTPFAGFPILLNLMARDTYAPRYFKNMGDRLVFNTGIWTLCLISVPFIIFFKGNTHSMLALYAIGVLLSFSFTGFGMARYVLHDKKKGWQSDLVIFLFGGLLSFFVFLIFIITKFTQGAWLVLIIIPLLVAFFYMISRVYKHEIKDPLCYQRSCR